MKRDYSNCGLLSECHEVSSKIPLQDIVPAKTTALRLLQLCHGRIAPFASPTPIGPIGTPKCCSSLHFTQTNRIVNVLMAMNNMGPKTDDSGKRLDVICQTETANQARSRELFGRVLPDQRLVVHVYGREVAGKLGFEGVIDESSRFWPGLD